MCTVTGFALTLAEAAPTACMRPWCAVPLHNGSQILFGYALRHPVLGGLSWVSSSEVIELDDERGRARTRSGRVYALGQKIQIDEIPALGDEPWIAFEHLVGDAYHAFAEFPRCPAKRSIDRAWLSACKAARHLDVAPPQRERGAVQAFMDRYLSAYLLLRAGGGHG